MKSIKKVFALVIITLGTLLFSSFNLSSQVLDSLMSEEVGLEDLLNMDVLSASRSEHKTFEAPGSVHVITEEIIKRRGYRTLTEVFEDVPGFDFTTKQPAGEESASYIFRGITDVGQTNLLIMVDGIIRNDISNGWSRGMGFDFPLIDVERIELIAGPGSALYGANAYAGLINVLTKQNDGNYLKTRLTYGSYGTIVPEILFSHNFENGLSVQLAGQFYYSEGDGGLDRLDPGNYFHNNYEPDSVLTIEHGNIVNERNPDGSRKKLPEGFNTSFRNPSFRGRIKKDGFTLGFSFMERNEGLGGNLVGYEYFTNTDGIDFLARQSGKTIFFSYDFDLTDDIKSHSNLFYRNTIIHPENGFVYTYKYQSVNNGINPEVFNKKKSYFGDGSLVRYEQQFNYETFDNNSLVFGFHLESQNQQYFGMSLGPEQDDNSTIVTSTFEDESLTVQPMHFSDNLAVFVQDEYKFFDNYFLTGGLRYDYDTEFGSTIIPRAALVGKVIDDMYFKLLFGQAYKAPTIFQRFDEWRGNENLIPQKITTYEAEIGYYLFDMLNIRANIYYSDLYDLLLAVTNPDTSKVPIGPNGEYSYYYQNIGENDIYGISLNGDLVLGKDLFISANYSFTVGREFEPIDNIAKHKINLAINYKLMDYLNINLRANYLGEVKAPITNYYFYPKDENTITEVGYDYNVEDNPDGFLDEVFLLNLTLTGSNFSISGIELVPQVIIRNLLDSGYFLVGRQDGGSLRPIDELQPIVQNPKGFIPAYHPQAGREIFFRLMVNF